MRLSFSKIGAVLLNLALWWLLFVLVKSLKS